MNAFDIATLRSAYRDGSLTPVDVAREVLRRTASDPNNVWIHRLPDAAILDHAQALLDRDIEALPLYGIPFAIKDNIDLAGVPTTAGCREFAYTPTRHAFVVQRLIDAGAIPIGKTNLDQFATGLNGTRSPYGTCRNAFNADYISGGSSSGSAVAVALGYCSFALGTDTAGSGRVPAALNNLVGHKPTRGWLSCRGVVPACRSLDCVSVFALNAADAEAITAIASAFDERDPYARQAQGHGFDFGRAARFRVGVPNQRCLEFFGNTEAEAMFDCALTHIASLGGECIEIDLQPFLDAARLLYEGPWVAERHAAIREFYDTRRDAMLPVIRDIIDGAAKWSATDAFAYQDRLRALLRECDTVWQQVDCIVTPTAGTIYTIAEMEADPMRLNANLGRYTNFMNLLDYAATAVPAGFMQQGTMRGLPFGVTLFAPAHQDGPLLHLAGRLHGLATTSPSSSLSPSLPSGQVRVAVCGAHLSGLPLNGQLTSRGARLVGAVKSAPEYKFYALPGGPPHRPGMVRVRVGGGAIDMEVWELPAREFGSFVAGIPSPLGIGTVKLDGGDGVLGFVCEAAAIEGAEDITALGSWRRYLSRNRN